jgi:type IV secretion system protein VirB9
MPDGSEVLTNSHTMDDVLVIHEVAKTLRLRLGKSVVDIYNGNFKQSPFNKMERLKTVRLELKVIKE